MSTVFDVMRTNPIYDVFGVRYDVTIPHELPVVVVDEPARWYWQSPQQEWDYRSDFGPMIPAFDQMVVCWQWPAWIHGEEGIERPDPDYLGVVNTVNAALDDDGNRVVTLQTFEVHRKRNVYLPVGVGLVVDENGRYVSHVMYVPEDGFDEAQKAVLGDILGRSVRPSILGMSMMHCKNVVRESVSPSVALNRKWRKKHGHALLDHVKIRLPSATRSANVKATRDAIGAPMPLHLIRGHFKTYTDDKPLFGKRTGTYWWGWQARGAKAQGERIHTYEVGTPAVVKGENVG